MAERVESARPTAFTEPTALGVPVADFLDDFTGEGCDEPGRQLRFELHDTDSDAHQIVRYLSRLATAYGRNPCVIYFARCLVQGSTRDNDRAAQFNVVAGWVLRNILYQADPRGMEYTVSPVQMLKQWYQVGAAYGDCDDHVLLLNSLLNALGIATRVVAVQIPDPDTGTVEPGRFNHVLSQVNYGAGWRDFDACNKENPFLKHPGDRLVQ